jgi:glutaminase
MSDGEFGESHLDAYISQLKDVTSPFRSFLKDLHNMYAGDTEGEIPDDFPALRAAEPDAFGICAVTVDGRAFEVGQHDQPFSLQEIANGFVYGLSMDDNGRELVHTRVGVWPVHGAEATAIRLEPVSQKPFNPLEEAGALAITHLIKGPNSAERLSRLKAMLERYIGHEAQVDMGVYTGLQSGGKRTRAVAHMLEHYGCMEGKVDETLDLYFKQKAFLVDCYGLASMGATLAASGTNPFTGDRAVKGQYIRDMLSIMYTCGLQEYTGEWGYIVGLPALGGLSGAVVAVVPGVMGIAVYSPRVNDYGISVRGIKVMRDLSQHFGLHILDPRDSAEELREALETKREGNARKQRGVQGNPLDKLI